GRARRACRRKSGPMARRPARNAPSSPERVVRSLVSWPLLSCRPNKRLVVFDCNIGGLDHIQITELNLLRLNTLGRLFVETDGRRLTGAAAQPRRLALLALLAAAGEQGRTRDQLLAMLWPETDEERARKGLNQAIYALRQEMGADDVFLGTRDLRLNPDL